MFQGCTTEVQDHPDSNDGLMAGLHGLSLSNRQCKEKIGILVHLEWKDSVTR